MELERIINKTFDKLNESELALLNKVMLQCQNDCNLINLETGEVDTSFQCHSTDQPNVLRLCHNQLEFKDTLIDEIREDIELIKVTDSILECKKGKHTLTVVCTGVKTEFMVKDEFDGELNSLTIHHDIENDFAEFERDILTDELIENVFSDELEEAMLITFHNYLGNQLSAKHDAETELELAKQEFKAWE